MFSGRCVPAAEGPKFKVSGHVRILKYKNIFARDYVPNWSEEIFVIEKVKNTVPLIYVISYFNRKENLRTFYKK